jgi:hypothetical protein
VVALGACSDSAGGAPGAYAASVPAEDLRSVAAAPTVSAASGLPARAKRGLEISPVPLALDGLDARQRMLVGLGSYIVNAASDCAGCHGGPPAFLAGGTPFELGGGLVVWTRNLTPDPATGLPLSHDQFVEALRTGRDFHGDQGMLVVMPWTTLRWSSDLDLDAIYAYLRAIPPVVNAVRPDVKGALGLPPAIPFDPATYTDGDVTPAAEGRRGELLGPARPFHHAGGARRSEPGRGSRWPRSGLLGRRLRWRGVVHRQRARTAA